mmetsp:Transcript_12254/g.25129  ORF Transcript_12254/g.25129 Transcript_12254/m.25129 type:complete len:173 (-) Transcript_12254:320-838(-)
MAHAGSANGEGSAAVVAEMGDGAGDGDAELDFGGGGGRGRVGAVVRAEVGETGVGAGLEGGDVGGVESYFSRRVFSFLVVVVVVVVVIRGICCGIVIIVRFGSSSSGCDAGGSIGRKIEIDEEFAPGTDAEIDIEEAANAVQFGVEEGAASDAGEVRDGALEADGVADLEWL